MQVIIALAPLILIFCYPFLVLQYSPYNGFTNFFYVNIISLSVSAYLIAFMTYGPELYDQIQLMLMGFDFKGMNDDERTRNVAPEKVTEAIRLYNAHMGIGWPLKAIVGFVFFVPYPTAALILYKIKKHLPTLIRKQKSCKKHLIL